MTIVGIRPEDLIADPFFSDLKAHVIEATGLFYYTTQDLELARHLSERLMHLDLSDCGAYWNLLRVRQSGDAELDLLIAQLTIGETFFFRHEEQYHALRDRVIPEVIERNRSSRRLRIWSAGCSTGAEPYSVAILLKQCWPEILAEWDVTILGTDINREFLAQARQGRFGDWALCATPTNVQDSCFSRSGNDWLIRPEFRRSVSFQYHNLVRPANALPQEYPAPFDIILCRNVMIYFSPDMTRQIIGRFHQCLTTDGWLVVGHAESNTEMFQDFETVNISDVVLYRKTATPSPAAISVSTDAGQRRQMLVVPRNEVPLAPPGDDLREATDQCREQLIRRPLNPAGHFRYALMLQQRGRLSEAERSLRRAIYLDRGFVLAHYYVGILLKGRGELTAAQRCFRNTLRLLEPIDQRAVFPEVEGIDASALSELTRMHLEELKDL